MDTEQIAVKSVSDEARVLSFIRDVKEAHPGKTEIMLQTVEWVHDYPDIEQLLSSASEQGLVDAFPKRELGQNEREEWNYWDVTLRPKLVKILKAQPREVRRQVTVDGQHVDIRNKKGLMMATSPIENLLALAQVSLEEVTRETDPKVRRAHVMYLRDLIGFRGHELPEQRKAAILEALSSCTQETRVGNR